MPKLMAEAAETPAFVHRRAFANIAHGNSSVRGRPGGGQMADYGVTE